MGREVRRVPKDWQHPQRDDGREGFKPLYPGEFYESAATNWLALLAEKGATPEGLQAVLEWEGQPPNREKYMPDWPEAERTHLMMYEDTSEGTPISPAFATPEELARWLADTKASAFASKPASYEAWLRVAQGGWAPSLVIQGGVMRSGVEDLATRHKSGGQS
jgi:hypothetical protein